MDPLRSAQKSISSISQKEKRNVLITSAGKRVVLVNIFKAALNRRDPALKVFTTDMNPRMAPAGIVSDKCFEVPRVTDEGYMDILLTICIENEIGLVIPTIDTELVLLAKNKSLFAEHGVIVSVSETSFVQICRDKRNTGKYLTRLGIRVPDPVDKYHPTFPLFAKPYDGSAIPGSAYCEKCGRTYSGNIKQS